MDSALVEFLNHLFLLGLQAWEGERLIAALLFFWPEFGRYGGSKIPRSWRCVKGWRRVTPGKQPQTAPPQDVRGCRQMLERGGFRKWQSTFYDQRVRVSAPSQRAYASHVSACEDSRFQNLVEQSKVIVHVADHCQYGRRWRMTTGFIWGNIDQRDTAFEAQMSCSRTNLPHLSLTCDNPEKVLWWTIARNRHNCFNKVSRTCTFVPLHLLI